MALLTAGYFATGYFPSRYWSDDYWPDYGTAAFTQPTQTHGMYVIPPESRVCMVQPENRKFAILPEDRRLIIQ